MRNPNGYGSVVKLSGKRRKPYMVRKTKGFNEKGHPQYVILGYTRTKKEGMMMLAEINKQDLSLDNAGITLEELFERWKRTPFYTDLSASSRRLYNTAHKKTSSLHQTPYKDIKYPEMQAIIDKDANKSTSTQLGIKVFFSALDKYALRLNIINNGYANLLHVVQKESKKKTPFTTEEIKRLWDMQGLLTVDIALVLLYTGFRLSAVLEMKKEKVFLDEGYLQGGVKNNASRNRIVPIHKKIRPIIERRMQNSTEYLFADKSDRRIKKENFHKEHWNKEIKSAGFDHTPHDARHTFRSELDRRDIKNTTINLLMGHSSGSIGERIYTHKTLDELRDAIDKITYNLDD
ncbi:MAG: tyrosine-type recombinase/integrase [Christensenellaceae bacterium]|jgi:integrase